LCEEFGFSELAAKLSEVSPSMDFKETEDVDARGRIVALEEKTNQHSHGIAMLQDKVTQLSTDFWRFRGGVSALRSAAAGIQTLSKTISALKKEIAQNTKHPVVEQLSTEFSELRNQVLTLNAKITAITSTSHAISQSAAPPVAQIRRSFHIFWRSSQSSKEAIFASVAGCSRNDLIVTQTF
jgi:outer membrane murein-binding lipoprotein Lpp